MADIDKGVEIAPVAEGQQNPTEVTQQETPAEEPKVLTIDDVFNQTESENAENKGLDSPPKPDEKNDTENQTEPPKPADKTFTQADIDKIVSRRLAEARSKDRAKYEQEFLTEIGATSLDEAKQRSLKSAAADLIKQFPDMKMTPEFAEMFASILPKKQASAPKAHPAEDPAIPQGSDRFNLSPEALTDLWTQEEAIIQSLEPDFNADKYVAENETFKNSLLQGKPMWEALKDAREAEKKSAEAAKQAEESGKAKVYDAIRESNSKAMTDTGKAKGTAITNAGDLTDAQWDELKRRAARGEQVYFPAYGPIKK